jgi:hypothetical protein
MKKTGSKFLPALYRLALPGMVPASRSFNVDLQSPPRGE